MSFEWISNQTFFTNLSIGMAVLPIIFAARVVRQSRVAVVMVFLLSAGLLTEVIAKMAGPGSLSNAAFIAYCFLESTLFWFLIRHRGTANVPLALIQCMFLFSLPTLVVTYFFSPGMLRTIAVFSMIYQVLISFAAGKEILRMVEAEPAVIRSPMTCLLIGIFFYCFTTFFLMGIIDLTSVHRLWDPYHNTINIITYLMYSFAFWMEFRSIRSKAV